MHKKGLISSVAITVRSQTNAVDNAAGISINNKDWLIGSIQYYGIGCLLSNAVNGKKLLAEIVNITGKQLIKVVIEVSFKPVGKGLKL